MIMKYYLAKGLSVLAVVALIAAMTAPVHADYLAQAITESDGTLPLPESLSEIAQKRPTDLIQIEWSEFGGKRPRIRVLKTENKTGYGNYTSTATSTGPDGQRYTWNYDVNRDYGQMPVVGLDAMLTDILLQTGRFDVVERESLDVILGEQDLGDSGRVSAPSAAKKGKKRGLGGIGRMLGGKTGAAAGGIKWQNAESRVGLTVQLVDMETSQIKDSTQVDVRLKARAVGFGAVGWGTSGALGGFMGNYSKTPIGQAMIAATNIGVYHLVKGVGAQAPEGVVADVSGGKVMVTMGQGQVQANDTIRVVGLGKEIFHPETGILLSRVEELLGELRITDVRESFSYAEPVSGTAIGKLKAGDKVVSTRKPEPYEYGPSWDMRGKLKKAVSN